MGGREVSRSVSWPVRELLFKITGDTYNLHLGVLQELVDSRDKDTMHIHTVLSESDDLLLAVGGFAIVC